MEEIKRSGLTLEQAKIFADMGIADVKNGFIETGYYLKMIRDKKLWKEQKYKSFEAFLEENYAKDKSWASRCISLYGTFGKEELFWGELPSLKPEYADYNVSQLIEMISLPEEKRELVTPETPVKAIRDMKPKREKKVATVATSEAEKNVPDPEEVVEVEKSCDVTTFKPEEKDQDSEPEIDHFFDRNESIDDAYGWVRAQVVKEYLEGGYKSPGKECKVEICGEEYWVIKGAEVTTFYDERKGYPIKGVTFDVENTRLEREYNFFFGNKEEAESKESEEEQEAPPQQGSGYYNPDDDSLVDESYSTGSFPKASDRHVTMFARLFVQENKGMLFHAGVFYGISDEEIIRMLKLYYYGRGSIVIDGDVEVSVGAEIIEFSRDDEDLGICLFQKFVNYVRKQIDEYISKKAEEQRTNHDLAESDGEEPEPVIEEPEPVPEQPATVPESLETVIDGEFVELILPDISASVKTVLEEAKKTLKDWMSAFEGENPEKWPPFIERQKIIVAALEALAEEQEQPESESEPEQPELPILKNNDQRAAFVDAYETWPLWIETQETGERYYRYDLPDGTSMVVKVYHAMLFDYKATGKKYEDRYSEGYGKHEYYFLQEGKFFRDCETNRSYLIEKLKELQKKGKGDKS